MGVTRIGAGVAAMLCFAAVAWCAEPAAATTESAVSSLTLKAPREIVDETVRKVLAILTLPDYKDPARRKAPREQIRTTILSVVDMNNVAQLTLANYRDKFSDEQFKQFRELFSRLLFSTYVSHMEKYSDEKVLILSAEQSSETRALVKTKTVTNTGDIPVDFSFARQGDRWFLYDVHIEGVSLVKNYRSQFREILVKRTAEQLLQQLREKVKENESKL